MFNKTRRRIVFAVVFSLLALIIVTMTTVYVSNVIATRKRQEEMLKTYVEQYSLNDEKESGKENKNGGELPPLIPEGQNPMRDEPQFRLSTFYSVAYSKTGEVLKVNNGNEVMQSEQSLIEISSSVLNSGKTSGTKGNLFYLVSDCGDYTLVAMIDKTLDNDNQNILLRQILVIGAVSAAVLIVISVFIARRIVKPLEESDKRQKRFISDAGHELKTPIAVISANSELLRRQIGENEWLNNIDYENERMADLVKQLLFLSKAERGEAKETLDFSKLTEGEVLPFETLAFEKGKKIESVVDSGITVEGNINQLRQLVSILLDNAISHGVGDTISLSLTKEKHDARLTVKNGAEELTANQLAHLFDRFYRTDEARSDSGSHYGLGLSIAQAVVKSHGGDIRAEYRDGQAIFSVLIPLIKIKKV